MRRGIMSLEGLEEPALTEEVRMVEVEDALDEMSACSDKIDDLDEDISVGIDAAETLGKIHEAVSSCSDDDATAGGSRALEIAVEHLYRSTGALKTKMPSFENLKVSKAAYRTVAMESIADFIVKVMKAIVNSIKRAIELIADFIKSFFVSTKALTKRVEVLAKEANSIKGKSAGGGVYVENKRILSFLDTKLGNVTADNFVETYHKHDYLISKVFSNAVELTESATGGFKRALYYSADRSYSGGSPFAFKEIAEAIEPLFSSANSSTDIPKHIASRLPEDMVITQFPLIFNNSSFYVALIKAGVSGDKIISLLNHVAMFIEKDPTDQGSSDLNIRPLEVDSVLELLGKIKNNLNHANAAKSDMDKSISELKRVSNTVVSRYINLRPDAKSNTQDLNCLFSYCNVVTRFAYRALPSIMKYSLIVNKNSLDYAAISISLIKKHEAKVN